jgi:hypothetical protein
VEAGVFRAPDAAWSDRMADFLAHQRPIWNWQNGQILTRDLGVEAYYYVVHDPLHERGLLLSSMMSVECEGVGLRGHVWTPPGHRRNGASSQLQRLQLEHFVSRGGRSLALFTDYNSVAYHMYRRAGFREVEPLTGHMRYLTQPAEEFEAEYFAPAETVVEPLSWRHWPCAPPLFMADLPGAIRVASLGLVGRRSPEAPLLGALRSAADDDQCRSVVLRNKVTHAIAGIAAWGWHRRRPTTCLLDVYCHPDYWDRAEALLAALPLPEADRFVAYADATCPQQGQCLRTLGFRQTANWPRFPLDRCRGRLARLPLCAIDGTAGKLGWSLLRAIDAPVSCTWRSLADATGASARVPAKWPRFPLTHVQRCELALYEKAN